MPLYVVDHGKHPVIWGGVRGQKSGKVKVVQRQKLVKTVSLRQRLLLHGGQEAQGAWQLRFGSLRSRVAKPVKLK